MRFLKHFFRRARAVLPPITPWPDGPDPAELPTTNGGANPILRLLDDWRIPYRETRDEVTARLGVLLDPIYEWKALVLSDALALPGAMGAWTASAFERIPPQFPISRFSGIVWFEDDAHANLRRTANYLAASLGPAPVGQRWNTLVAAWRSGLAEVSLVAWPPEWQSDKLQNPAEDREPRLRTACHVHVATGFRLSLSGRERDWVASFQPIRTDGEVGTARMARAGTLPPSETETEYVRDPEGLVADRQRALGLSIDEEALIVVSDQLFVVPRDCVLRLEVTRLTRAKGAGGSTLYALCRTKAPAADGQSVFLAQASDPDGMSALAHDLGARLGCPVAIGQYHPDC